MPITINGSGTITGISAGGLPDNCVTAADLATTLDLSSNTVTLPSGTGGKILQVQTTGALTSQPSTSSQESFGDISGFSANITPAATGSKVLVIVSLGRVSVNHTGGRNTAFRILRDSTAISVGATAGSRLLASFTVGQYQGEYTSGISYTFLDSPSTTSQVTYKLQWTGQAGEAHYINRGSGDSDHIDLPNTRTSSSITLMEVGA